MKLNSDKESLINSAVRRLSISLRFTAKVSDFHKMDENLICKPEDNPNYILKVVLQYLRRILL